MRILIFLLCLANLSFAQSDTFLVEAIPELEVKALRINTTSHLAPFRIYTQQKGALPGLQALNIQEFLNASPGLFSLNATNYAQDLRIAIRGFGARASFGIRGIKLIVDGIPETSPDGQGQLDNTDPMNISSVEVLNGPAASLYGNASGGVLSLTTLDPLYASFVESRINFGSFKFQQYQLKAGLKIKNTKLIVNLNQTSTNGYRVQSAFKSSNLNMHLLRNFDKIKLHLIFNYTDSPIAEDPGSLNIISLEEDRKQARGRNVDFKTGEAIDQLKIALKVNAKLKGKAKIQSYAFFTNRNFNGKLPFEFGGIIDLKRTYYGAGFAYINTKSLRRGVNTIRLGLESNIQSDDRNRFRNLMGEQGPQTLDQEERFENYAAYLLDHLRFGKFLVQAGLRYDINKIKNIDAFLSNGDDSGSINWNAFNPSLGISYQWKKNTSIYTNFRTAFETPSLNELSNNPFGQGFNLNLNPQQSTNYEIGFKYRKHNKLLLNLALFHINTTKEFVPFELENMPDQTFFRNAGSSTRNGVEISTNFSIKQDWNIQASYTYSDFKYKDYLIDDEDFGGNQLPGIPKNYGFVSITRTPSKGLNVMLESKLIGSLFTSDSNEIQDIGYTLVNLKASYIFNIKKIKLTPFAGINNILDSKYNDNIRINAFGGRYYEAGPGINYYGGINLKYTFDK